MYCFTSRIARKSESVGRNKFVNVMYEYHYKHYEFHYFCTQEFIWKLCPGPRSYHEVQLGTRIWQQMRMHTFKPHPQIYIYKSNWQNIESLYSWNNTSNWSGLSVWLTKFHSQTTNCALPFALCTTLKILLHTHFQRIQCTWTVALLTLIDLWGRRDRESSYSWLEPGWEQPRWEQSK